MWHLLDSSPMLTFLLVFYAIDIVAVLIYASLTRDCAPRRNDCQPSPPVDSQMFFSPGPRRSYVESDRRFAHLPYSWQVAPDRRLWTMHHWCSTEYAKMLADASEKIRL